MKTTQLLGRAAALLLLSVNSQLSSFAQGTGFTYQGRLNDNGATASGNYDLSFTLHDTATRGAGLGTFVLLTAVPVSKGLFTVTINTNNEFGAGAFTGAPRWLEIGVRPNGGGFVNFTLLSPRQPVTPTPYAIFANSAGVALTVPDGSITSAKLAAGAVTAANIAANSITAAQLAPGAVAFPQLAKAYQSGSIPSSALPLTFGDYLLVTNFPIAFDVPPVLTWSVAQTGSLVGSLPQVSLLTVTPTNYTARITQPPLKNVTVKTFTTSNGITSLSATRALGLPAVAYASASCELAEGLTCVTNFDQATFLICKAGGGSNEECSQAATEVECTGNGSFYQTNCASGLRFGAAQNSALNIWLNATIATSGTILFPSLSLSALPFQSPMVAYFESNSTSLYFSRAATTSGATWPAPVQVVNHADVGRYCSLGLANGNPAIAYYNATTTDLEYIRATNSAGIFNAAARVTVSGTDDVGQFCSLATVQGRPAIATYYNPFAFGQIVYFRAGDANGSTWGSRRTVATTTGLAGANRLISLAEVNGLPAIAYYDSGASLVKYVRALDVDGASWAAPSAEFPATSGDVELDVINGRPVISFHVGNRISIATAQDANGAAWSFAVTPSLGTLSPNLGALIAHGTVPGLFHVTAGANQTLRYATPFTQSFILNWIAVEP